MFKKLKKAFGIGAVVAATMMPIKDVQAAKYYDFTNPTSSSVVSYSESQIIQLGKDSFDESKIKPFGKDSSIYLLTSENDSNPWGLELKKDSNGEYIFDDTFYSSLGFNLAKIISNTQTYSSHNSSDFSKSGMVSNLNFSLTSALNYNDLIDKLKINFTGATVEEKKKSLSFFYDTFYESYDKSVKSGHFYEISQNEYFNKLKSGGKVGNCGDISCVMLDVGKEVFGLDGLVLSRGIHMLPIFKFGDKDLFTPEKSFSGKSVFDIMEKYSYTGVSNIVSNCDDGLIAEVQSFLQRTYQKIVMPGNITRVRDFGKVENFESKVSDTEIFVIGNPDKNIIGFKKGLVENYELGEFSGSFGVSGFFNVQSAKGQKAVNVIGVSGFHNFSKKFNPSFVKNLEVACGNFTKGIIEGDISNGFGVGRSASVSVDLSSEAYCLAKYKDNLVLSSSVGVKPYFNKPNDQTLKGYVFTEVGASYSIEGFKFDLSSHSIGSHTSNAVSAEYSFDNWKVEGEIVHNEFGDDIASSILPKLQKRLTATYAKSASFSIVQEGGDTKIMFNLDIPFSVIGNKLF
ncbi:MAG: hypothetical protein ACI8RP_001142 [Urechidicola sp.]|jgi:hypothetical protein